MAAWSPLWQPDAVSSLRAGILAMLVVASPVPSAAAAEGPTARRGVVVAVLDGQTLEVQLGKRVETVRHIGIGPIQLRDSASAETALRRATAAHADLLQGREVILRSDVAPRDAAGRLLADVTVEGGLVSAELVRLGFAEVVTLPPNVGRRQALLAIQAKAQAASEGLWGDSDVSRLHRPARSGVLASRRTMSFFHVDDDKGYLEEMREYFETPEAAIAVGYVPSFEYAFHAERERRGRQAAVAATQPLAAYGSTGAPVVQPVAVVQPVLLPQPATNVGHIWRGGVFIPIRR
jgi:micrococcal nuclease